MEHKQASIREKDTKNGIKIDLKLFWYIVINTQNLRSQKSITQLFSEKLKN